MGCFIKASTRVVSRGVHGFGYAVTAAQLLANLLHAIGSHVVVRCQPCDGFEDAMEVITTHPHMLCQGFKIWRFLRCRDEPTGLRDHRSMLLGECWLMRLAPFAGAKASLLGIGSGRMKLHMLWSSPTRCAGRSAVHPSGLNRVIKRAICLSVAGTNRCPPWVFLRC